MTSQEHSAGWILHGIREARIVLQKIKYDHVSHLIQAVFILGWNYQNYSSVNLHLNYVQ